jgi:hypothetical protein
MLALCDSGARFADASDADLDALRQALQPVYDTLRENPQTAEFIAQIEALKAATDPGPALAIPPDCTGPANPDLLVPSPQSTDVGSDSAADNSLDGTYRWTLTPEDARTHDPKLVGTQAEFLPAVATMTLDEGTWELSWQGADGSTWVDGPATYSVDGDDVVFHWPQDPLGSLSFTIAVDGDGNIDLEPVPPMDGDSRFVWAFYTWERISSGPEPVEDQGVLNGVYRWELTADEVEATGVPPGEAAGNAGIWTWTLEDGRFEFDQQSADVSDHREGTYEISGDRIEFLIPGEPAGEPAVFTWELGEDGSMRLSAGPDIDPLYVAVFTTKPWKRID